MTRFISHATGCASSRVARLLRVGCLAALSLSLATAGCALPSRTDMETAQALIEVGDAFNEVRSVQAELQDRIDSLVTVVARQDSTIRTLANLAGVRVLPR